MRTGIILWALLSSLSACRPHELAPREFVNWVENESHGLRIVKEIGKIKFDLQYQPVDYLITLQEKRDKINTATYKNIKKEKEGLIYFRLRLEVKDSKQGDLVESL